MKTNNPSLLCDLYFLVFVFVNYARNKSFYGLLLAWKLMPKEESDDIFSSNTWHGCL